MFDAAGDGFASLFRYENEPAAATSVENLVFCSSFVDAPLDSLAFGVKQQTQLVLSDSFETKHVEHVHFEDALELAAKLFGLIELEFGLAVEQQAQLVFVSSFCTRHVEQVHLAADAGLAESVWSIFFESFAAKEEDCCCCWGLAVQQQAQLVLELSFCTRHVVQVHLDEAREGSSDSLLLLFVYFLLKSSGFMGVISWLV